VGSESGDMSENEDGILLVPEAEAGVCMRVQNWNHRRRGAVARGSEGLYTFDEELSDGEVGIAIRFAGSNGFKPALKAEVPPSAESANFQRVTSILPQSHLS